MEAPPLATLADAFLADFDAIDDDGLFGAEEIAAAAQQTQTAPAGASLSSRDKSWFAAPIATDDAPMDKDAPSQAAATAATGAAAATTTPTSTTPMPPRTSEKLTAAVSQSAERALSMARDINDRQHLGDHLQQVTQLVAAESPSLQHTNLHEQTKQYELIQISNKFVSRIDAATKELSAAVHDVSRTRFPQLGELVKNAVRHARVVDLLLTLHAHCLPENHRSAGQNRQNQSDTAHHSGGEGRESSGSLLQIDDGDAVVENGRAKHDENNRKSNDLSSLETVFAEFLPQHTILALAVTASSWPSTLLSSSQRELLKDMCTLIMSLHEKKKLLIRHVSSRMVFIAPNLCALIGPDLAARLINAVGSLKQLAELPAGHMVSVAPQYGSNTNAGLAAAAGKEMASRHGLLLQSEVVLSCPASLQQRAVRLLACQCAIAARCDMYGQDPLGKTGRKLRDKVDTKIAKWQEPPPSKMTKALPAPNMVSKKKRGGRRYKAERDRFRQTELAKMKNRMTFGKAELVDDYSGEAMGLLGQKNTGFMRVKAEDNQRLKNAVSKELRTRMQKRDNRAYRMGGALGSASVVGGGNGNRTANVAAAAARFIGRQGGGVRDGTQSSISFAPSAGGIELVDTSQSTIRARERSQVLTESGYFSSCAPFRKRRRVEGSTALSTSAPTVSSSTVVPPPVPPFTS